MILEFKDQNGNYLDTKFVDDRKWTNDEVHICPLNVTMYRGDRIERFSSKVWEYRKSGTDKIVLKRRRE